MATARCGINVISQEMFLLRCAEHKVAAAINAVQISVEFGLADKIVAHQISVVHKSSIIVARSLLLSLHQD